MHITAIKAQIRNPNRVSIYIDGRYTLSLTIDQLLELKLRNGLEVSTEQLTELHEHSAKGKLYARVLNYLSIRPRSQKEVLDYCWRKKVDPQEAQALVEKLTAKGYLDDAKFARSWVESRQRTTASSMRKVRMELQQKGIAQDIITQTLKDTEYSDNTVLQELVQKKRRLGRYQDDQKLLQYLVRQGFSLDDVKRVVQTGDS